jgi:MFS-type transporter involved in bile tolerance (Atg22 family)
MRKRTIRNGMRLVLAALVLIIIASFYHDSVGETLSLSIEAEMRFYRLGIFWAAAMGGYGVVLAAFGLVLPGNLRDSGVRVMPAFFMIVAAVSLFFYLLAASFDAPANPPGERLRPGETITI